MFMLTKINKYKLLKISIQKHIPIIDESNKTSNSNYNRKLVASNSK